MLEPAGRDHTTPTAGGAPLGRGALLSKLRAWTRADVSEPVVLLSVLSLCVTVRLLRLQPIELYDDEVMRWSFVRQWFYDNGFRHGTWTHHMARFGVNLPLFAVQALWGRGASIYYIWPVASFALQVMLTYLTTRRLAGQGVALGSALLLSVFTGLDRGASQILPDAFGGTALVLVLYALVRYHDALPERRTPWLLATGAAFIWAYEIKESNLLFAPGLLLATWQLRGRGRDAAIVGGTLAAAIALETLLFRALTEYPSRFAIVGEAHGFVHATFWGLFERFTRLEPSWQMLFWTWLASAAALSSSPDRRTRALLLLPAGFVLLLTFLVRSVTPVVVWTRFYSRYFEPAAPLMVIASVWFFSEALKRAWTSGAPARLRALALRLAPPRPWLAVGACLAVGAVELSTFDEFYESALHQTRRFSRIVNDAYRRNLPIVVTRAPPGLLEERRARPLKLIYGVYLDDRMIATSPLAPRGLLPDVLAMLREGERHTYLLRDPSAYAPHEVEDYVQNGCGLVARESPSHPRAAAGVPSLTLDQAGILPAACRAPRP